MKNSIIIIIAFLSIIACKNDKKTEQATEKTAVATAASPNNNEISLSQEQLDMMKIEVGKPILKEMPTMLKVNGLVSLLANDKASVGSKMNGKIEQIFIHEGQPIQKGQKLMSISSSQIITWQQEYLQAKNDMTYLEKELQRQQFMQQEQVGAAKNLQEIQSKFSLAKANVASIKSKLDYIGLGTQHLQDVDNLKIAQQITVTAPISGHITEIPINLGLNVSEGSVLCNIVNLEDLHVHAYIYPNDIQYVKEKQKVKINFSDGQPSVISHIEYMSKELDQERKAFAVHIPIAKTKAKVLPGTQVNIEIEQSKQQAYSLPASAVQVGAEEYTFFALTKKENGKLFFKPISFTPMGQQDGFFAIDKMNLEKVENVVLKRANILYGELKRDEMQE